MGDFFNAAGAGHNIIVTPLQDRFVPKALEQFEQEISGPNIGFSLGGVVPRKRDHLHKEAHSIRRHATQHTGDDRVRRFRLAIFRVRNEHDG